MKYYRIFFCLIFSFLSLSFTSVFAQPFLDIDSAKKSVAQNNYNEKNFIATCFFIADNYMDIEQYDSAQIWLNKIHDKLPAKNNSLSNYFLLTRQAEVYYYNNLQQLGLQESLRGLDMAKALNDSLLLADSYNFLGLFNMNIDSAEKSLQYFKEGIRYTKQPPFSKKYLSLTKPHHLYGNFSEAFYKLKLYDSALYYNKISLQKATEINWQRGIAVAHKSMGDVFLALNNIDSATYYYNSGILISLASVEIDVELLCRGGLAQSFYIQNGYAAAKQQLDNGFDLLKKKPMLNRFFALQFLTAAINIYKNKQDNVPLIHALEIRSGMETSTIKGNNTQIQTILNAGVSNEKRLLKMEVTDAQQKQKLANSRLVIVLIIMTLLGISFMVYRYYQNQKMVVSKIRNNISQDLHDDIGASLSSLQIYGAVAEKTFTQNPAKALEMLHKISVQSKQLMENMGDIIWSMNLTDAKSISLETKLKDYSVELLSENDIKFTCNIDDCVEPLLKKITAKRNILLLIKEAMNNIAKYSHATNAILTIDCIDKQLILKMTDNGIGFDPENKRIGNGISNMKKRVEELKGVFTISSSTLGTVIHASIPIKEV